MSTELQTELETYCAEKERLLAAHEGKFVVIQGKDVLGVWDTYEDALRAGFERFSVSTPFLVKQISGIEQVHYFTRDIACQS